MKIISNPAFWAALGSLLAAVGIEMIPAQQLADHVVAAVAGIAGIIGIITSMTNKKEKTDGDDT